MPRGEYNNDSVTLVPGFLRGFRAWGLGFQYDAPTLVGAIQVNYAWHPERNEADCPVKRYDAGWPIEQVHQPPALRCGCGFYARVVDDEHRYIGVKGIIKATGNIILGTKGFRAQYAEIEAFYVDDSLDEYLGCVRGADLAPPWASWARFAGTGPLPSWGAGHNATSLLEMLAIKYGVNVYSSAAEAQMAFPFPSVEGLIPPESEPEPEFNPYVRGWLHTTGPLVWGPPSPPLSPYRGERKRLKPVPFSPRRWRTK